MKKLTKMCALLLAVLTLSGCVKYEVGMDIHKDKSMDFSLVYALSDSSGMSFSDMISDMDELETSLKKNDYEISDYAEDDYTGIKITKKYKNIDKVSGSKEKEIVLTDLLEEDNFDDSQLFTVKKGIINNTYSAKFLFDLTDTDDSYSSYADSMTFQYKLKLPYKVGKNNADSVSKDGKTLIWNVNYGDKKNIEFTFKMTNNQVVYIIIGIAGALVLVIMALFLKKNNHKNKTVQSNINNDSHINNEIDNNIAQDLNVVSTDNVQEKNFTSDVIDSSINNELDNVSDLNDQENVNNGE